MVPSGIKVNSTSLVSFTDILDFIYIGESNIGSSKYACYFEKMIQYWRAIWNNRTNGITDVEFPFGFVQVSSTQNHLQYIHRYIDGKEKIFLVVINKYER
jgi:hypothetical protein